MSTSSTFDIVVIGGGINGVGIAADAAGRGLSVCLLEQGDLAGATSSASSKLIHGGLRYLEHYEFSLVREALEERERLLRAAPHIVAPLRFVLPHVDGMRPRWLLRAGLFLYDHLSRRQTLPASHAISFSKDPSGAFLKPNLTRGFSYWDCWVDDARLVVLNARAAAQKGAVIKTRTAVTGYHVDQASSDRWIVHARAGSTTETISARVLVNAAGPWVDTVAGLETQDGGAPTHRQQRQVRLVKGSHLVVHSPRQPPNAYMLQNFDDRVVFVIPFEKTFTLIGTTDVAFDGDPAEAHCSDEERAYLLNVVNRFMGRKLTVADVVHDFSGVRPLYDDAESDPSKVTRDYRLELRRQRSTPPMLTVLGGKITTYRRLAEDAVNQLSFLFPDAGPAWTANHPLPGGALSDGLDPFRQRLVAHYPNLDRAVVLGIGDRHGSDAYTVLGDAQQPLDMGAEIMPGLTAREVRYLREHEWAATVDDVLWRRTKFGLHVDEDDRNTIEQAVGDCLAA